MLGSRACSCGVQRLSAAPHGRRRSSPRRETILLARHPSRLGETPLLKMEGKRRVGDDLPPPARAPVGKRRPAVPIRSVISVLVAHPQSPRLGSIGSLRAYMACRAQTSHSSALRASAPPGWACCPVVIRTLRDRDIVRLLCHRCRRALSPPARALLATRLGEKPSSAQSADGARRAA